MPGANCAIFGCGTSRKQKISIFKLPNPAKGEFHKKCYRDILNIITRNRVVDEKLKKLIHENKLFICERHFDEDQIYSHCKFKISKFLFYFSNDILLCSWVVVKILFIV